MREQVVKGWRVVRRMPDGSKRLVPARRYNTEAAARELARLCRLCGDKDAIYDVEPINGYDDAGGIANVG